MRVSQVLPKLMNAKRLLAMHDGKRDEVRDYMIEAVQLRKLEGDDGEPRDSIVIHLVGVPEAVPLNKTNARTIAELLGDETDHWQGHTIGLCVEEVESFGSIEDGVRVKEVSGTPGAKPAQKREPRSRVQK